MYALKSLSQQPLRFVLTTGGVALCVLLMLFLLSVYYGVSDGSVEYVRANDADLWVLQQHTSNILRGFSILAPHQGYAVTNIKGVDSSAPVLFILASVKMQDGLATIYLTGYDSKSGRGGPPRIKTGRNVLSDDEIVLDASFAAKHKIGIGETIPINKSSLKVVGLSSGTNMFVIQYAFVTLQRARSIAGFANIASCYLVKVEKGVDPLQVADRMRSKVSGIAVYDSETFLRNNINEMRSGFLPLLYVIALIGAIVLTSILSLILSINVLEQRQDFAVMKALGSPGWFIPKLVFQQALMLAGIGTAVAIAVFFPLTFTIEKLTPEVSTSTSITQLLVVTIGVGIISLIGSILPNRRLSHIYPLEVFK